MSSYEVLAAVSRKLRDILWDEIKVDPQVGPIVGSQAAIVFLNPTQTARDSSNKLSLWLYQVAENEHMKNQPMQRGAAAGTEQFPPLALNLFYLVTPFAPTGEADHLLLGKTMQVLYDNATVLLRDSLGGIAEELRVILCRLTLEELTHIWEALREPYRLSVCYQVRVTRIESERLVGSARVVESTSLYQDKPQDKAGETVG